MATGYAAPNSVNANAPSQPTAPLSEILAMASASVGRCHEILDTLTGQPTPKSPEMAPGAISAAVRVLESMQLLADRLASLGNQIGQL